MAECVNLRERFGKMYRITFDEAYDHKGVPREKLDPWAMCIPCEKGTIYPYGGNRLSVEIDHHGPTANKVRLLPGVVCIQDGDNEKTFTFPIDTFEQIATIVQPKKRRVLTEEQKQAARQRLASHQFRSKSSPSQARIDPDDESEAEDTESV